MQLPEAPSITRRSGIASPKVEIVVACEGKVTEKYYLESCKIAYGSGLVKIRWLPITGVPMTVVNAAIDERKKLLKKARRKQDSFDGVFRVWAIFDRDIHPKVSEALQLAESNKIDVAFSDPCFELWPLLHLLDYGGTLDRHKVQGLLHQHMPSYHHDRSPIVDFEMIKDKFSDALQRADLLLSLREMESNPNGCPSTTVGVLVKKILENGRGSFSRNPSRTR